jgi:hypothetical protein
MNLNAPLERLLEAAHNHSEDTGEDHQAGDLQDLLRAAWGLMTVDQKRTLLRSSTVESMVETGARDEYDQAELLDDIEVNLASMEAEVAAAGYLINDSEAGLSYWSLGDEASGDAQRADTIVDAYNHLVQRRNKGAATK